MPVSGDSPRPTRGQLLACVGRTIEDVIAPDLDVVFCGINPGLYTAYVGHHFARPGNRFWPALHRSGFTSRQFTPSEERKLLTLGFGITNVVLRATATAAELSAAELVHGGEVLAERVRAHRPRVLAVLGVTAYRAAFRRPRAGLGPQPDMIGPAQVWVLPNPSGLNAHYTPQALAREFAQLHAAVVTGECGHR